MAKKAAGHVGVNGIRQYKCNDLFLKLEICIKNRKTDGTINRVAAASTFLAMLSTDWRGDEFYPSACRTASKEMSGTMQEAAAGVSLSATTCTYKNREFKTTSGSLGDMQAENKGQ